MLYSFDWQYPVRERPTRIRLEDGSTKTAEAITDQMLISAGWVLVEEKPEPVELHHVEWERNKGWVQIPFPPKPFDSWVFNQELREWQAPIPKPQDNEDYYWSEEDMSWKQQTWYVQTDQ